MAYKVIVFGTGQIVDRYKARINLTEVDSFIDNNPQIQGTMFWGKPVLAPEELLKRTFDYVVIFSSKYFVQIYQQLLYELAVPMEKIVDFRTYIENVDYEHLHQYEHIQQVIQIMKDWNVQSILDADAIFRERYFLNRESQNLFADCRLVIDACSTHKMFAIGKNLYDNIFSELSQVDKHYDLILFYNWERFNSWQDYYDILELTKQHSRYIAFFIPFPYGEANTERFCYPFFHFGRVRKIQCKTFYLFIIDKKQEVSLDLQIYIVTHKKFLPPEEEGYVAIQAGKQGKESLGYLGDDTGEHISHLNPYINECTALYWMWKNAKCEYIGLSHYRRFFLRNDISSRENIIDKETVKEILEHYDIILVREHFSYPNTVGEVILSGTEKALYYQAYDIVRNLIAERQPEYVEAFDCVMSGYVFFRCNMFITRKKIMDGYCVWLFSFLLDAVQKIDVSSYSSYSQRMLGFFAERMLTVWLMNQELKIKEMPIIELI